VVLLESFSERLGSIFWDSTIKFHVDANTLEGANDCFIKQTKENRGKKIYKDEINDKDKHN